MLKLTIETDNDAFEDDAHQELARILQELAIEIVASPRHSYALYDINGNRVGVCTLD